MEVDKVKELLEQGKASQIGRWARENKVKNAERLIDIAYEDLRKDKK